MCVCERERERERERKRTCCQQLHINPYIHTLKGGIRASKNSPSSRLFSVSADNVAIGSGGQRACQRGYMLDPETSRSCVDVGECLCWFVCECVRSWGLEAKTSRDCGYNVSGFRVILGARTGNITALVWLVW